MYIKNCKLSGFDFFTWFVLFCAVAFSSDEKRMGSEEYTMDIFKGELECRGKGRERESE